ncbi:MAG: sulfur carrier protein ThiS [Candidatus Omnitrophica bacterium]|nr:sulfur carrier protein ThiS [Candidatus Omnitrophota bacterium]
MQVYLNEKPKDIENGYTISQLLEYLKIDKQEVTIERNLKAVQKADYDGMVLKEGDRLEIVRFVGGG